MIELRLGQPQPKQIEFLKATNKYVAFGGARGGGKSWVVRFKAIILAMTYNGIKCLILRRTYQELRDNHIVPLQSALKDVAQWKDIDKAFVFPNGSRIMMGYLQNDADLLQYQGKEYDVIFLDEATHFSEYQFRLLEASIRGVNNFPKRFYLTCNPGGKGHAFIKRLFITQDYLPTETPSDYCFIQSKVYDNYILLKEDPDYVKRLEQLPEDQRKAWLDGNWDVFTGQFFPELNRDIHIIEPFTIPDHWLRYTTMDYGMDMLAHYEIAVDTYGDSYVIKEIHESGLIVSEAINKIRNIEDHEIYKRLAPPDLWNTQSLTGKSTALLFNELGMMLYRSNNDRIGGWSALRELLKVEDRKQPDGTTIKTSRLKIFKTCKNLINSMFNLQYDERRPNDAASEPHEFSHSTDAARYFAVSWVSASDKPKEYNFISENFKVKIGEKENGNYIDYSE